VWSGKTEPPVAALVLYLREKGAKKMAARAEKAKAVKEIRKNASAGTGAAQVLSLLSVISG
jgi:hypothetical protein